MCSLIPDSLTSGLKKVNDDLLGCLFETPGGPADGVSISVGRGWESLSEFANTMSARGTVTSTTVDGRNAFTWLPSPDLNPDLTFEFQGGWVTVSYHNGAKSSEENNQVATDLAIGVSQTIRSTQAPKTLAADSSDAAVGDACDLLPREFIEGMDPLTTNTATMCGYTSGSIEQSWALTGTRYDENGELPEADEVFDDFQSTVVDGRPAVVWTNSSAQTTAVTYNIAFKVSGGVIRIYHADPKNSAGVGRQMILDYAAVVSRSLRS